MNSLDALPRWTAPVPKQPVRPWAILSKRPNFETLQEVMLPGGIVAVLTPVERNQFRAFTSGVEASGVLRRADARMYAVLQRQAATHVDLATEIVSRAEAVAVAKNAMAIVSLEWLDTHILAREVEAGDDGAGGEGQGRADGGA